MSRLGPAIARLFGLCLEVIFWLVEEAGDLGEWKLFCWLLEEGGDLFEIKDSKVTYFGQNVFLQSYSSAKA